MILEALDRISDRIFRGVGKNAVCVRVCSMEEREVQRTKERIASGEARTVSFYRRVLLWQEQGLFFQAKQRFFRWILQSRASDIGFFLLSCGAVGVVGNWVVRHADPLSLEILIPLAQALSASVLLRSSKSVSRCMRRSLFLRWLLFDFCGLSESILAVGSVRRERGWSFILAGCLIGGLGVLWSATAVALILLGGVLLTLLSAVPELAFLLLFLLLPFLNLTAHPTLMLTAAVAVCCGLCGCKAISGKRQVYWSRADGLVLWLCCLFFLSGVISYGDLSEGLLRGLLLFSAWFPIRLLLLNSIWRRRAFFAMSISSFVCAVWGILQYVLGKAELRRVDTARFGDIGGRVCGLFGNPNLFAIYLLFTVPLSLGLAFHRKGWVGRAFFFSAFGVGSLCLVFTWSRGAWIAWMLSVLLFLMLCSRRSLSCLFAVGICGSGLISYLTDSSANYRIHTWRGVCRMLRSHPWGIGCGESAFRSVFPAYAVSGTESVMHPHQIFLQVFTETGLAGLLLFAVILWHLLRGFVRFCGSMSEGMRRTEGVTLFCILTGGLVMGCFDSLWYHYGLFWLFWSLCAMLKTVMQEEVL